MEGGLSDKPLVKFPEMASGQYCVFLADASNGKMLNKDGQGYANQLEGSQGLVFDTIEDATSFSKSKITDHPEIECIVHDSKHAYVSFWRNEDVKFFDCHEVSGKRIANALVSTILVLLFLASLIGLFYSMGAFQFDEVGSWLWIGFLLLLSGLVWGVIFGIKKLLGKLSQSKARIKQ